MREIDPLNSSVPGIVMFQEAIQPDRETEEDRVKKILERDFDEFKKTREYVIANREYLIGKTVPMEVTSCQFNPHYECMILNDLILLPFNEASEYIKTLKERETNGTSNPYSW